MGIEITLKFVILILIVVIIAMGYKLHQMTKQFLHYAGFIGTINNLIHKTPYSASTLIVLEQDARQIDKEYQDYDVRMTFMVRTPPDMPLFSITQLKSYQDACKYARFIKDSLENGFDSEFPKT